MVVVERCPDHAPGKALRSGQERSPGLLPDLHERKTHFVIYRLSRKPTGVQFSIRKTIETAPISGNHLSRFTGTSEKRGPAHGIARHALTEPRESSPSRLQVVRREYRPHARKRVRKGLRLIPAAEDLNEKRRRAKRRPFERDRAARKYCNQP